MNEDPKVNVSGLPPEFVDAGASGNISAEVSSQVPVLQPEPELVVNPWALSPVCLHAKLLGFVSL